MNIRRARYDDMPRIMEVCAQARSIMRADGNMTQWTGGYPSEDIIRKDIDVCAGHVLESDGKIEGYFALVPGIEQTYLSIEDGRWADDGSPYCTIHRLASTTASHGVAKACFEWCWSRCRNIRIDTHRDNRIMRHCIEKFGFTYCGIIHLSNGDPRLAYQKAGQREDNRLLSEMLSHADPAQVAGLSRFFKTGPGQYGEGDRFLGIKVPVTRSIVKECWKETGFDELEECICSEYHEIRLAALLSLVQIFTHARRDEATKRRCIDFYLDHTGHINNWDLVDLSCYEILGRWLLDKDRSLLYDLARNGKTIWEQRIGMVSTMQFIRNGELDDTYAIAEIFLEKPQPIHDLLQKAGGWLLRDAGKRDEKRLRNWINANIQRMPRTMLRYAIEKFPEEERKALQSLPIVRSGR